MAKKMKKCPFCGAEVKKENLKRHLLRVHNEIEEEEFEQKGFSKPVKTSGKRKHVVGDKKKARITKRKRKKRTNKAVMILVFIVFISMVGVIMYQNLSQDTGPNGGTTNGNGNQQGNPLAVITTTHGVIKIRLYEDKAPITAGNFINLAQNGFYNGLIFHRVVPGFVIQAGGFTPDGNQRTAASIPWEDTGYANVKYTIAMARSGDPNTESGSGTATSQFFINLADNAGLDGYTYPFVVFGIVEEGFDVVDAIGNLPTGTQHGMSDWPDNPPVINSITI